MKEYTMQSERVGRPGKIGFLRMRARNESRREGERVTEMPKGTRNLKASCWTFKRSVAVLMAVQGVCEGALGILDGVWSELSVNESVGIANKVYRKSGVATEPLN